MSHVCHMHVCQSYHSSITHVCTQSAYLWELTLEMGTPAAQEETERTAGEGGERTAGGEGREDSRWGRREDNRWERERGQQVGEERGQQVKEERGQTVGEGERTAGGGGERLDTHLGPVQMLVGHVSKDNALCLNHILHVVAKSTKSQTLCEV